MGGVGETAGVGSWVRRLGDEWNPSKLLPFVLFFSTFDEVPGVLKQNLQK